MQLNTTTVNVGNDWTLVTHNVAMLQFNDEMYVVITHTNTVPTVATGFTVQANDMLTNPISNSYVWVKSKLGGTKVESVRVTEEII